jgi:hypothetical protein
MIGLAISFITNLILKHSSNNLLRGVAEHLSKGDDKAHEIAMKRIEAEIDARRGAREIRLATAAFWEMRLITFIIALCFTSHLVLVTLDTNFGLGWRIAKFPAPFDEWQGVILLSFFGVQVASQGINAIANAVAHRK